MRRTERDASRGSPRFLAAQKALARNDNPLCHCQETKGSLDLQSADISSTAGAPPLPMNGAWRTIRSYILWQHERGTLHYDIMVTLILIFIFLSPRVINFNDKPRPLNSHPTGILVTSDGAGGLVYQIDGTSVTPGDDAALRAELLQVIEPISGHVSLVKYQAVLDQKGKVQDYRVWVKRKP
jgi:hypothetical protein